MSKNIENFKNLSFNEISKITKSNTESNSSDKNISEILENYRIDQQIQYSKTLLEQLNNKSEEDEKVIRRNKDISIHKTVRFNSPK